jgi:acetyl-CoA carboxylase biotin carboxyl carrier protein
MPDPRHPSDRSAAQREADHAGLARLSDTLVPALVAKLNSSGLGELEVREGDWRIRLRRPAGAAPVRRERPRTHGHGPAQGPARPQPAPPEPADPTRVAVTAPAVGVFRQAGALGSRVRSGDRVGVVDLLGIPQDVVAPIDGILVEFLADTGDPVEYGEDVAVIAEPVIERAPGEDAGGTDAGGTAGREG